MDKSIYFEKINNLIDEHNIQLVDFADCNGCEICRKIEFIRKALESKEKMRYTIYKHGEIVAYANNKKQIEKITKINLNRVPVEEFLDNEINGFVIKVSPKFQTEAHRGKQIEYELYRDEKLWLTVKGKRELAEILKVTYWTLEGDINGKYFKGIKIVYK